MHPDCWPERVIVMTLDRVGTHSGPDLERLRAIKAAANGRVTMPQEECAMPATFRHLRTRTSLVRYRFKLAQQENHSRRHLLPAKSTGRELHAVAPGLIVEAGPFTPPAVCS